MDYQADQTQAQAFLLMILSRQAGQKGLGWLEQQKVVIENEALPKKLYLSFSMASRFFNKEPLQLSAQDLVAAEEIRNGFRPYNWDVLQTARTYLLLLFSSNDQEVWFETIQKLFETADMHEQEALYAALPLMPYPLTLRKRAAEGIRTNITSVFDAVALENPYPADFLEQEAWNQMVLKAVFMQRPLYRIYKADERANEEMANMLIDFAHERWAAGRKVMPELWRFVGPFLSKSNFADIERVVKQGDKLEQAAGLLACSMSTLPEAKQLLDQYPETKKSIQANQLKWKDIGERFAAGQ